MNLRHSIAFIAPLLLVSNLSPKPVQARSLNSTCLLEIDGTTYMDDRCHFSSDTDSDFFSDLRLRLTCPDGLDTSKTSCYGYQEKVTKPGVFGYLFRQKGVASLCWNEGTMRKASPCFEGLRRSGACWSNSIARNPYNPSQVSVVKFCAWAE
jgi:hypothetical protein